MNNELELVHQESQLGSLTLLREPSEVLEDAQKVAAALMEVVKGKKKQVTFNGETYLESGDWQTVAAFHGVTAKVEWTHFVEYGEVKGFEAAAVAIDRNGREVSRGEAMCLNDEENWGTRTKYEWVDVLDAQGKKIWEFNAAKGKNLPKREKQATGVTVTPLFQLRSMAQTRACAKALSNLFKWVVVLAGYKPTPAEEMTGRVDDEPGLPSEHQNSSAPQVDPTQPSNGATAGTNSQTHGNSTPTGTNDPQQSPYAILAGTTLTCTPLTITEKTRNVRKTEENPEGTQPYIFVYFKGNVKTISEFSCFDTGLFEAIRAGLNYECQFKVEVKDGNDGKTHINVKDVMWIDNAKYVEGKPVNMDAEPA